jgi:parallel beta-helix repeat protein
MPEKLRLLANPATLIPLVLSVALVGVGVVDVGDGQARASHVRCGDTITADTTLDGDVVDCPNNGIVIGADNITLHLNGHTVSGDGAPVECPRTEFCDVGLLNDGHEGVTVRNGSVRRFGSGVFIRRASRNRVLGISSSRNQFFGFVIAESARSLVRHSSGNRNPDPDGDGIGVFGSRLLRILQSSFDRNALGMHVEGSANIVIKGNRFSRNSGPGILVEANHNVFRRNQLTRNGAGIVVAPGNRNLIAGNRLTRDGEGLAIEKGRGNVAAGNVVMRPRRAGIRLGVERPPIGGAGNVVRGNLVRGSGADGFLVMEHDRRSVLRANVAIAAGDDGFDVESRSAKLIGNRAVRNSAIGIEAVPGVIDGGGNRARGNGDPLQCTNVFCS